MSIVLSPVRASPSPSPSFSSGKRASRKTSMSIGVMKRVSTNLMRNFKQQRSSKKLTTSKFDLSQYSDIRLQNQEIADQRFVDLINKPRKTITDAKAIRSKLEENRFFDDKMQIFDQNLRPEAIVCLAKSVRVERHKAGDIIYSSGDQELQKVYIVYRGDTILLTDIQTAAKKKKLERMKRKAQEKNDPIRNTLKPSSFLTEPLPLQKRRSKGKANTVSLALSINKNLSDADSEESQTEINPTKPKYALNKNKVKQASAPNLNLEEEERISQVGVNKLDSFKEVVSYIQEKIKSGTQNIFFEEPSMQKQARLVSEHNYFGDESWKELKSRNQTAIASSDCILMVINYSDFEYLTKRFEKETYYVLEFISRNFPYQHTYEEEFKHKMIRIMSQIQVKYNNYLCIEGEPADYFHLVYKGNCQVLKSVNENKDISKIHNQSLNGNVTSKAMLVQAPIYTAQPGQILNEDILFSEQKIQSEEEKANEDGEDSQNEKPLKEKDIIRERQKEEPKYMFTVKSNSNETVIIRFNRVLFFEYFSEEVLDSVRRALFMRLNANNNLYQNTLDNKFEMGKIPTKFQYDKYAPVRELQKVQMPEAGGLLKKKLEKKIKILERMQPEDAREIEVIEKNSILLGQNPINNSISQDYKYTVARDENKDSNAAINIHTTIN